MTKKSMRLGGLWILALAMLLTDGVPARAEIVSDPGFESCSNPVVSSRLVGERHL
jgi:hypothetical protein